LQEKKKEERNEWTNEWTNDLTGLKDAPPYNNHGREKKRHTFKSTRVKFTANRTGQPTDELVGIKPVKESYNFSLYCVLLWISHAGQVNRPFDDHCLAHLRVTSVGRARGRGIFPCTRSVEARHMAINHRSSARGSQGLTKTKNNE
jgi:hypothetical protein